MRQPTWQHRHEITLSMKRFLTMNTVSPSESFSSTRYSLNQHEKGTPPLFFKTFDGTSRKAMHLKYCLLNCACSSQLLGGAIPKGIRQHLV